MEVKKSIKNATKEDVLRKVRSAASTMAQPLVMVALRWAYVAEALSGVPQSGSAYFTKAPVQRHDEVIAWLIGDKRLANMAGAYNHETGADYVLSGSMRLLGEYRDAVQNHAKVMTDVRNSDSAEAREAIATAAMRVTLSKQLVKRRLLNFAGVIASWAKWGWRISDPELKEYKGHENSHFDAESKAKFESSLSLLGFDFSGKAGTAFGRWIVKWASIIAVERLFVQRPRERAFFALTI